MLINAASLVLGIFPPFIYVPKPNYNFPGGQKHVSLTNIPSHICQIWERLTILWSRDQQF